MPRGRKLMSNKISRRFRIAERRAIRVYDEMSAIVKKKYDDDILLNALTKNARRVVRMRKKIEQWRRARGMIAAINHVTYHRANVVNAKMRRFRNLLIQFKKRAKTAKWRLDLAEIENEKLFNIFETERVKIENEFLEKEVDISIRITKKTKWKNIKMKNEVNVVTTIEDEYKTKSFMNRLTIAIARKQRVERSLKNKNKNKNKIH